MDNSSSNRSGNSNTIIILYRREKTTKEEGAKVRGPKEKLILKGKMTPELEAAMKYVAKWDGMEKIGFFAELL